MKTDTLNDVIAGLAELFNPKILPFDASEQAKTAMLQSIPPVEVQTKAVDALFQLVALREQLGFQQAQANAQAEAQARAIAAAGARGPRIVPGTGPVPRND